MNLMAKDQITKQIAIQVLNFLNEINQAETGAGKQISSGGSFKVALFEAFCVADLTNFNKLANEFRGEAQAIFIYKNADNGLNVLKNIAGY